MGKPRVPDDMRDAVLALLRTDPMPPYSEIAATVGISKTTVGRIALAEGLRASDNPDAYKGARIAAEVHRQRTAITRAGESARIVANIADLNNLWAKHMAGATIVPRELTELAKAASMLTRAHADLEGVERLSRQGEPGIDAASMLSTLSEQLTQAFVAEQ